MSGRRAIRWRSIKIGIVVSLTTETLSMTKIVSSKEVCCTNDQSHRFLSCLTAYDTCIVKKNLFLLKEEVDGLILNVVGLMLWLFAKQNPHQNNYLLCNCIFL